MFSNVRNLTLLPHNISIKSYSKDQQRFDTTSSTNTLRHSSHTRTSAVLFIPAPDSSIKYPRQTHPRSMAKKVKDGEAEATEPKFSFMKTLKEIYVHMDEHPAEKAAFLARQAALRAQQAALRAQQASMSRNTGSTPPPIPTKYELLANRAVMSENAASQPKSQLNQLPLPPSMLAGHTNAPEPQLSHQVPLPMLAGHENALSSESQVPSSGAINPLASPRAMEPQTGTKRRHDGIQPGRAPQVQQSYKSPWLDNPFPSYPMVGATMPTASIPHGPSPFGHRVESAYAAPLLPGQTHSSWQGNAPPRSYMDMTETLPQDIQHHRAPVARGEEIYEQHRAAHPRGPYGPERETRVFPDIEPWLSWSDRDAMLPSMTDPEDDALFPDPFWHLPTEDEDFEFEQMFPKK
ncbi:hypothetical protein EJ08DRAFT_650277 [Tothia fuscella]|uniref:Uncharacterized protein n=1 Tax=Tothia fuscella TaxID=1048955 RepID=A0A9P4TY79_9PEZI|nr:hypothetical protein EJ08DRAFT_650277 [Tothia fuscella]